MNCKQANEVLMLDLYGEASAADVAELKSHLAGCAPCRQAAEASRAALTEFRREPTPRPSRDTVEAVLAAAQPRPRLIGIFAQLRPALWQAVAVTAVALTAVALTAVALTAVALTVSVAVRFWPQAPVQLAAESSRTATQTAATETSWDADSAALSEHIQLAQADATISSSLDNRISGLRVALNDLRDGSTGF